MSLPAKWAIKPLLQNHFVNTKTDTSSLKNHSCTRMIPPGTWHISARCISSSRFKGCTFALSLMSKQITNLQLFINICIYERVHSPAQTPERLIRVIKPLLSSYFFPNPQKSLFGMVSRTICLIRM